jgi:hypothetical protein
MPARARSLPLSFVSSVMLLAGVSAALAQSAPADHTGVVPDDDLTLVVGTRFVAPPGSDLSARKLFTEARIPLGAFNETDRCVDQTALEVAQEYFAGLGRVMGKAGHYYFVPEDDVRKALSMCERMHGPPKAWVETKTQVIAFGRVVPTADAPALEKSVR